MCSVECIEGGEVNVRERGALSVALMPLHPPFTPRYFGLIGTRGGIGYATYSLRGHPARLA